MRVYQGGLLVDVILDSFLHPSSFCFVGNSLLVWIVVWIFLFIYYFWFDEWLSSVITFYCDRFTIKTTSWIISIWASMQIHWRAETSLYVHTLLQDLILAARNEILVGKYCIIYFIIYPVGMKLDRLKRIGSRKCWHRCANRCRC